MIIATTRAVGKAPTREVQIIVLLKKEKTTLVLSFISSSLAYASTMGLFKKVGHPLILTKCPGRSGRLLLVDVIIIGRTGSFFNMASLSSSHVNRRSIN